MGSATRLASAAPPLAGTLRVVVQDPSGAVQTPEVFPRADGTTYVAYSSIQDPLPLDPAEVTPAMEQEARKAVR